MPELVGLIKKPTKAPLHNPDDAQPLLMSSGKTGTPILAQPHCGPWTKSLSLSDPIPLGRAMEDT